MSCRCCRWAFRGGVVVGKAGWTTGIKWIELESETRGPFCLVDMPGYGDAVATDKERTAWVGLQRLSLAPKRCSAAGVGRFFCEIALCVLLFGRLVE